jgi:hypothetical protein
MPGEGLIDRGAVADRREPVGAVHPFHLVELLEHLAVGGRIGSRETAHLFQRPLRIEPHGEALTIGEDDVGHRVGLYVGKTKLRDQAQLVF